MPAAAVIPALIVYTKIAAVKKLVVGFWGEFFISDILGDLFSLCVGTGYLLLGEVMPAFGVSRVSRGEFSVQGCELLGSLRSRLWAGLALLMLARYWELVVGSFTIDALLGDSKTLIFLLWEIIF